MSSCAVQEIINIADRPLQLMLDFCRQVLGPGNHTDCRPNGGYSLNPGWGDKANGNKGSYTEGLGENYIFHGVEKDPRYKDANVGYATAFAAFITEHKLGNVVGGDTVSNHRFHPDHFTRVFIWNPDRQAVIAWWALNDPALKTAPPAKAQQPPIVLAEAPPPVAAIEYYYNVPVEAAKPARKRPKLAKRPPQAKPFFIADGVQDVRAAEEFF